MNGTKTDSSEKTNGKNKAQTKSRFSTTTPIDPIKEVGRFVELMQALSRVFKESPRESVEPLREAAESEHRTTEPAKIDPIIAAKSVIRLIKTLASSISKSLPNTQNKAAIYNATVSISTMNPATEMNGDISIKMSDGITHNSTINRQKQLDGLDSLSGSIGNARSSKAAAKNPEYITEQTTLGIQTTVWKLSTQTSDITTTEPFKDDMESATKGSFESSTLSTMQEGNTSTNISPLVDEEAATARPTSLSEWNLVTNPDKTLITKQKVETNRIADEFRESTTLQSNMKVDTPRETETTLSLQELGRNGKPTAPEDQSASTEDLSKTKVVSPNHRFAATTRPITAPEYTTTTQLVTEYQSSTADGFNQATNMHTNYVAVFAETTQPPIESSTQEYQKTSNLNLDELSSTKDDLTEAPGMHSAHVEFTELPVDFSTPMSLSTSILTAEYMNPTKDSAINDLDQPKLMPEALPKNQTITSETMELITKPAADSQSTQQTNGNLSEIKTSKTAPVNEDLSRPTTKAPDSETAITQETEPLLAFESYELNGQSVKAPLELDITDSIASDSQDNFHSLDDMELTTSGENSEQSIVYETQFFNSVTPTIEPVIESTQFAPINENDGEKATVQLDETKMLVTAEN